MMKTVQLLFLVGVAIAGISAADKKVPCEFPFTYDDVEYKACTIAGSYTGQAWCETADSWRYCDDDEMESTTDKPLAPCVFPFIYKGVEYTTCTIEGSKFGLAWCSLTDNYDVDSLWRNCNYTTDPLPDVSCKFPFTFDKTEYNNCTTDGSKINLAWCATSDNLEKDEEWKYCSEEDFQTTPEKVEPGCVLPFTYSGELQYKCISSWSGSWCSTTSNYDEDGEWKNCSEEEELIDLTPEDSE